MWIVEPELSRNCHITDTPQRWPYAHAHAHVNSPYFVSNLDYDSETKVLLKFCTLAIMCADSRAGTVTKNCHITDTRQDLPYAHAHTHVNSP